MDNRRGFMAALAGFFGLNTVAQATPVVPKLEGFIVLFIDVGSLPPFKAEAFVERVKDQWKKTKRNPDLTANWETIWIPSRTQETHAEFYPLNGEKDAEGKLRQIEGMLLDYTDEAAHPGAPANIHDPLLRTQTLDYVSLMLGAPVHNVDQMLVKLAYDNVFEHVISTGNAVNSMYLTEGFVKEGTLGFAKMFVGRKRIKDQCGDDNSLAFYEEGRDEVHAWTEKLNEIM